MYERPKNFLPMCDTMKAFLQDIKANSEDDGLRMIFADWLEDHGDPRGPMTRDQLSLFEDGYTAYSDVDYWLYADKNLDLAQLWLHAILPSPTNEHLGSNWLRGLLRLCVPSHALNINLKEWPGGEWWPWCEELCVDCYQELPDTNFLSLPCLHELTSLTIDNHDYWGSDGNLLTSALAESPYLSNLKSFSLCNFWIDDYRALEALAESPYLSNLKSLSLFACLIQDSGALALAESPHWNQLNELDLRNNDISEAGKQALYSRFGNIVRFDN